MNGKKVNCWEFKECGHEPGGRNSSGGVCPAAVDEKLDGIHRGEQAGRSCWIITGTLCNGGVQGNYKLKSTECLQCDFYQLVRKEEIPAFKVTSVLMDHRKRQVGASGNSPQHVARG